MKRALPFYRKLVLELREMGFEINPYDPCVANKMINGTQMTIRWHVDDLMISHVSQDEIMKIVQGIKVIYGENLTEAVGTVHDYLGMTIDYSFTREARVNMWDYLGKVIKEFPEEIIGTCVTPASDHLFKVREDGRKLNEELADAFHHTVYQLLFAANRARRDIQTAVSFLTTRVKAPDEDNWGKLVRVLKYINGTRYEANPKCRRDELHCPLVRGRFPSDPQELQRTNWMSNDDGEGSSNQLVEYNEM